MTKNEMKWVMSDDLGQEFVAGICKVFEVLGK